MASGQPVLAAVVAATAVSESAAVVLPRNHQWKHVLPWKPGPDICKASISTHPQIQATMGVFTELHNGIGVEWYERVVCKMVSGHVVV